MAYISYLYEDKLSNYIRFARQSVGSFDIDNIGGTVLHVAGDQRVFLIDNTTTPSNGQGIYRWNDLSGFDNDCINTVSSNQPTYVLNGLNGLSYVAFSSASSQYLIANKSGGDSKFNIDTPTIILVGRWNSGAAFCGKGDGNQTDGRHRKLMIEPFSAGALFSYWAGTDAMSGNTMNGDTTQWSIYIIRAYRNNYTDFNFNGVKFKRATPVIDNTSLNTAQFTLGCGFQHGAEFGTVDIAEFMLINRLITDLEVTNIKNYLSNKWGITVI